MFAAGVTLERRELPASTDDSIAVALRPAPCAGPAGMP